MKALRFLLALLVLAIALAPFVMHVSTWAPHLVQAGYRRVAVASLAGCVAWFALWLRALPAPQVRRP